MGKGVGFCIESMPGEGTIIDNYHPLYPDIRVGCIFNIIGMQTAAALSKKCIQKAITNI